MSDTNTTEAAATESQLCDERRQLLAEVRKGKSICARFETAIGDGANAATMKKFMAELGTVDGDAMADAVADIEAAETHALAQAALEAEAAAKTAALAAENANALAARRARSANHYAPANSIASAHPLPLTP